MPENLYIGASTLHCGEVHIANVESTATMQRTGANSFVGLRMGSAFCKAEEVSTTPPALNELQDRHSQAKPCDWWACCN